MKKTRDESWVKGLFLAEKSERYASTVLVRANPFYVYGKWGGEPSKAALEAWARSLSDGSEVFPLDVANIYQDNVAILSGNFPGVRVYERSFNGTSFDRSTKKEVYALLTADQLSKAVKGLEKVAAEVILDARKRMKEWLELRKGMVSRAMAKEIAIPKQEPKQEPKPQEAPAAPA